MSRHPTGHRRAKISRKPKITTAVLATPETQVPGLKGKLRKSALLKGMVPKQVRHKIPMETSGRRGNLAATSFADAEILVVPREDLSLVRKLGYVRNASGRLVKAADTKGGARDLAQAKSVAEIPEEAFEPSARARAVLRGVQAVRDLLAESGGTYQLDDVRMLLGNVTRQAVEKRVREGHLLAVTGPHGRRVYPTIQFQPDGATVAGIKEIQEALPSRNAWGVLSFLVGRQDALDGRRPIDLLKSGDRGSAELALEAARRMDVQGS